MPVWPLLVFVGLFLGMAVVVKRYGRNWNFHAAARAVQLEMTGVLNLGAQHRVAVVKVTSGTFHNQLVLGLSAQGIQCLMVLPAEAEVRAELSVKTSQLADSA